MIRREDWPSRLDAAVEAARALPFDWAAHNCATFAADCVLAMTGVDMRERFRDQMVSQEAREAAAADIAAEADAILGARLAPRQVQRGDVVALTVGESVALGVCLGARAAVVGESGLLFYPMRSALCGWRI